MIKRYTNLEMRKINGILFLLLMAVSACNFCIAASRNRDYVEYVNPLMGSQSVHSFLPVILIQQLLLPGG